MRKRIKRNTAIPVGSSDYHHVRALRESLEAGHDDRKKAISMMAFSEEAVSKEVLPKHRQYYVLCFGKKQYITYEEAMGYVQAKTVPVHWE